MTTKEKILDVIKDINYAYNDCSKYDTIKNLLEEMEEEMEEERKKGKWEMKWHIIYHTELPRCTACERFVAYKTDFCPHCGADMRGDGNDK